MVGHASILDQAVHVIGVAVRQYGQIYFRGAQFPQSRGGPRSRTLWSAVDKNGGSGPLSWLPLKHKCVSVTDGDELELKAWLRR